MERFRSPRWVVAPRARLTVPDHGILSPYMTITVDKPVAGGTCLGRVDGKAVFVPYTLPGETAEIEIIEDRKGWAKARLVSVIHPSPRRTDPVCPLFGVCGGCSMQMAESAYQTELRVAVAADSLRRAGSSYSGTVGAVSGEPFGYRSRAQFHVAPDGLPGFTAARSSSVVPIRDCPVLVDPIREALANGTLASALNAYYGSRPGRGNGGFTARGRSTRRGRVTEGDNRRFHVFADADALYHEGEDTRVEASVGGRMIAFDVRGFFQSNIPLLERLLEAVTVDLPTSGTLLDFYAGVGTFSAFAAPRLGRAVLVEHNGSALEYARENAGIPRDSLELCPVSDEAWARHPLSRETYAVAIVDPPRQGIARPAMDWFVQSSLPEIRYVSCDPVTFARDAALLERGGFALESVTLFDFYPQTHHAEVYGRFTR